MNLYNTTKLPVNNNNELLTLAEYTEIAEKIGAMYLARQNRSTNYLSDELIGFLTYEMIKADLRWDPSKNLSTYKYRRQACIYAAVNFFSRLDSQLKLHPLDELQVADARSNRAEQETCFYELLCMLEQYLDPRSFSIIQDRFLNRMTLQEMAFKYGVTGERIRQILQEKVGKLQQLFAQKEAAA